MEFELMSGKQLSQKTLYRYGNSVEGGSWSGLQYRQSKNANILIRKIAWRSM